MLKKYIDNTFVHIGSAFIFMGAWAYFANRLHAPHQAIFAAVLQGMLSATITFFMKKALEGLSAFFIGKKWRWPALVATPLIVCMGSPGRSHVNRLESRHTNAQVHLNPIQRCVVCL